MRSAILPSVLVLGLAACTGDDTNQKPDQTAPPLVTAGSVDKPETKAVDPHAAPGPVDPHAEIPAGHPPMGTDSPPPPSASPGLGVMPEYESDGNGMGIASVRPDGAGAAGGIKEGDVIVKFAGVEVSDVHDYMAALGTVKVGEKIEVVVRRKSELETLSVVVGESRR